MSFNFGPTLLSWLEQNAPRVHEAIVHADGRSQRRYSGHGSAMAQVYNHLIMPLASTRDRITQIRWGIADFRYRFGREPEGMWLPETAVDSESLDLLAQHGIRFVLLAPHQCARVRSLATVSPAPKATASAKDSKEPAEPRGPKPPTPLSIPRGRILSASKRAAPLPSSSTMDPARAPSPSRACSTAAKVLPSASSAALNPRAHDAQIVHVATDGESYGHHHRYGEMALAWVLHSLQDHTRTRPASPRLTNYGEFLEKHPPQFRSPDRRRHLLELRARHRTLAFRLRLLQRPPGLEPEMAHASARGARLRCAMPSLLFARSGCSSLQRSLSRSQRLHQCRPRSLPHLPRRLLRLACPLRVQRGRAHPRPDADGAAAPRPAHVHQLWLVLRRHLRHRDRPGDRLRRPRAAAGRGTLRQARRHTRKEICRPASPPQKATSRAEGWRHRLQPLHPLHAGRPRTGRRPLRHQLYLHQLPRRGRHLLLFACGASPTIHSCPAACDSPLARRSSVRRSPKQQKPWPSPSSTSAIRTSPPS